MIKWTIRSHFAFDRSVVQDGVKSLTAAAWEQLRTSEQAAVLAQPFHLPASRSEWQQICFADGAAAATGQQVAEIAKRMGARQIISVGVGRACVEFHLKNQFPQAEITCTEATPGVLLRLGAVFPECDHFELLDLLAVKAPASGWGQLVLLHRVDTELSDHEWNAAFAALRDQGVKNVLVVATGFLTARTIIGELRQRFLGLSRQRCLVASGYSRTNRRFCDLWRPHFLVAESLRFGELTGFLLRGAEGDDR